MTKQVLSEHNYVVLNPNKLIQQQRCQIRKLELQVKQLSENVYALRRQLKRKTESHDTLRSQLETAKKPRISMTSKGSQTIQAITVESEYTGVHKFLHEVKHRIGKSGAYTDYIMDFSFRMFFISPKGYIFLRGVLERTLPHPTTFSRWKKPIDTRPGNMS